MRLPIPSPAFSAACELAGRALPALLFLALVVGQLLAHPPAAQDDLLRNVVAYAWSYDYTAMYPMAPGVPRFDPYLGFDWLWGQVAQATSPLIAMHSAQVAGALAFLAALVAPLAGSRERVFRTTLVVALTLATLVTSRLVSGRPEVLATAWLLSAAALRPRTWLVLGVLVSPAYWLMPVYALGGFLLQASWRARLASVVAGMGLAGAFWLAYAGWEWLGALRGLGGMEAARAVAAVEAGPLTGLLTYPGTWLLLGLLAVTVGWHRGSLRESKWLVVLAAFMAIGSVRHILVLAPVAALFIVRQPWPAARLGHWCSLAGLALVAGTLSMQQLPSSTEPKFELPSGSVVLTGYNRNLFLLPFHNPGRVALVPSIESAWDAPEAVQLALATGAGELTCNMLQGRPFGWVISQRPPQGECFTRAQEREGWTLWQVAPPTSAAPGG
ncbi:hypothetical protein D3C71_20560 [compost metagenome]